MVQLTLKHIWFCWLWYMCKLATKTRDRNTIKNTEHVKIYSKTRDGYHHVSYDI